MVCLVLFIFCLFTILIALNYNSNYVGIAFRGSSRQLIYRDFITINNSSTVTLVNNNSSLPEYDDFPSNHNINLNYLL